MVDDQTDAMKSVVDALIALRQHIQKIHGNSHRCSIVSASQSDAAYNKLKSGGRLDSAELVTVLFSNSLHIRQFQTSVFVTSKIISETIDEIEGAFNKSHLTGFLGQLRSAVERFAHLHHLYQAVQQKLSSPSKSSHKFISSIDITDDVKNTLYGTAVKWNEIAGKALAQIDLEKDLGKKLRSDLGRYFATNILDKIDTLDGTHPGTRAAYEILCEFLHPNVGDLFASTTEYAESYDRFGIKHITRRIDLEKKAHQKPTSDRKVLQKVFLHCALLAKTCCNDFEKCAQLELELENELQSYTTEILKKYRRLFKKVDLCPCSSGEPIFRCCGRGLLLG